MYTIGILYPMTDEKETGDETILNEENRIERHKNDCRFDECGLTLYYYLQNSVVNEVWLD